MQYVLKVLNSSLSVTRTVSDTNSQNRNTASLRVAVDGSGNCRLVAYTYHTPNSTRNSTADQRIGICHVYQCLSADTNFTRLGYIAGIKESSQPFWNSFTSRFYLTVTGYRGGSGLANGTLASIAIGTANLLIDITASNAISSYVPPSRFRVAACLGEYTPDASNLVGSDTNAYFQSNKSFAHRPAISSSTVLIGYGQIGLLGTRQYSMAILTAFNPSNATFSVDSFSGGICGRFDGLVAAETGFAAGPQIFADDQKGGTLAAGTYSYTAIWAYRDKESKVHFSRCAEPITIVSAGGTGLIGLDISVPGVSSSITQLSIQLFRTTSGGTQYFRVATAVVSTPNTVGPVTESYITFQDQLSDATLQNNALLYRQPGTSGTALDRVSAVSGRHVVRHKDRVFYCHENTVYYSSFDVDGEAPWFSPGLSFDVVNGEGPIVGLSSMDGTLVIFKRGSIYLVDGDGPTENGGSGNEFYPPRRLNIDLGCIDARSIVNTPDGIFFRSQRGIELLNRSYKLQWIGQEIQRTVNANPFTGGACYDHGTGRVYMALGSTLASDGGHDYTQSGCVVVYDALVDAWSKFFYTNTNSYGNAMQDVIYANATVSGVTDNIFLVDHNNGVFAESKTSGLDASGSFVPWVLGTAWIRAASKQDRIRVTDIYFLGNRYSGHNLQCTAYYNWDKTTPTVIRTFDATGTNIIPEQLVFQPNKEAVQSVKFIIQSLTPTNPTTLGSGQGGEINGITVRLAPRGGGAKLPVGQKG